MILLQIDIKPKPAPRPRVTRWGTYNDPKYTAYKGVISGIARAEVKRLLVGAVKLNLIFEFKIPKSWTKKKRNQAHLEIPVGDCDNLGKGVMDALEGIVFKNDRQVKELSIKKFYGDRDMVFINISQIKAKGSLLHNIFVGMKQRCEDSKAMHYKNYGGRGIKVYKPWHNFDNFAEWCLKNGYRGGLQIDRIDNDGNYEPTNCRFVTRRENMRNTRRNIHTVEEVAELRSLYTTGNYTQKELSKLFKDSPGNISNIIRFLLKNYG